MEHALLVTVMSAVLVMNAIDELRSRREAKNVPAETRAGDGEDVPAETRAGDGGDVPAGTRAGDGEDVPAEAHAHDVGIASGTLEPARTGGDRATLLVHLAKNDITAQHAATLEDGMRVSAETLYRIACDAGLVPVVTDDEGRPLDVGRKTRSIPPAIRRALLVRDQCCRFPGCNHTKWLDAHHLEHWMHGGETKLDNLVLLCPFHHRLLHEGRYRIEGAPDGELRFLRPDGRTITLVPIPPLVPQRALATLRSANQNAGAIIDEHTGASGWRGESVDYSYVVGWLRSASSPFV